MITKSINAPSIFQFHNFQLEVIDKDGEPWFIARPLAEFLGYQNPAEAINTNVDEEDRSKIYIPTKSNNYICVNESGLYMLVVRSNKPDARPFRRWVTSEVLPSIRKTGSYSVTQPPALPTNYIEALQALIESEKVKMEALLQIEADKPKVEFAMTVRNMRGACSVGDFAKTIGYGRNRFFKMMRDDDILMKSNIPYQRYIDQGLFVVIEQIPYTDSKGKEHPAFTTMVTGKGQVFLEKKYRRVVAGELVQNELAPTKLSGKCIIKTNIHYGSGETEKTELHFDKNELAGQLLKQGLRLIESA